MATFVCWEAMRPLQIIFSRHRMNDKRQREWASMAGKTHWSLPSDATLFDRKLLAEQFYAEPSRAEEPPPAGTPAASKNRWAEAMASDHWTLPAGFARHGAAATARRELLRQQYRAKADSNPGVMPVQRPQPTWKQRQWARDMAAEHWSLPSHAETTYWPERRTRAQRELMDKWEREPWLAEEPPRDASDGEKNKWANRASLSHWSADYTHSHLSDFWPRERERLRQGFRAKANGKEPRDAAVKNVLATLGRLRNQQ